MLKISDAQALAMLLKWRKRLGLAPMWRFTVWVNHSRSETRKRDRSLDGKVSVKHEYYLADFTLNAFNHSNLADFEETVVHELLHVAVAPLVAMAKARGGKRWRKIVTHAEESIVTTLSKSMLRRVNGEIALRGSR